MRVLKTLTFTVLKMAAFLIVCLFVFIAITAVRKSLESFFMPEDFLFYELQGGAEKVLSTIIGILIGLSIFYFEKLREIWNTKRKQCIAILVVALFGLYYCSTNLVIVTEDSIIRRTPLQPLGTEYSYGDVEHIKTGFGDKKGSLFAKEYEKIGNFYYIIGLDGKEVAFHLPYYNEDIERYEEDSYLELEEFDQKLVALHIPKESSAEGYIFCELDQQCVDRFLRIIALQP